MHPIFRLFIAACLISIIPLSGAAALDIQTMQTYHDNGKLWERYSYFEDEWGQIWKHGPYASWNAVGLKDETMSFSFNSRNGAYTRYIYAGDLSLASVEQGTYEDGRKVGTWVITPFSTDGLQGSYEYAASGNLLIRSREQRRYQTGPVRDIKECELKDGMLRCIETDYYADPPGVVSQISRDVAYQSGTAQWVEGFHPNGRRSYAGYYWGAPVGRWNYWADDGFMIRQTDYVDGQKHGIEIEYPAYVVSGIKDKIIQEYQYGALHGDFYRYDESGTLMRHHRYVDGVQDGEQREFYLSGSLFWKYFMKAGERHGLDEWYHENGALDSRNYYVDGKAEGPFERYYDTGQLMERGYFRDDERDGGWESYHDNGVRSWEGEYSKGTVNGVVRSWNDAGKLESEFTYVAGVKHGPAWESYTQFYSTGAYGNGSTCGTWLTNCLNPPDGCLDNPVTTDFGTCEGLHVTNPETPYYPDTPSDAREIRGRVTEATDGRPVTGVSVYAGTGDPPAGCTDACGTTDEAGYYRLLLTEAVSTPLTFSAGGYYGHKETADLTDREYLTVNVRLKRLPPVEQDAPAVTKFASDRGRIFLSTVPVTNTYTAAVNWNGASAGTLVFTKNGVDSSSPGDAAGGSRTYNMAADFTAGLDAAANTLSVKAVGTDGKSSAAMTLHPMVIPTPAWSLGLGDFSAVEKDGVITYGLEKAWPDEPFSVQISPESLGDALWTAWGFFPLVGGKTFGIPPTQFTMGVSVNTDGVGGVSLGGKTGFEVGGGEIEGAVKGTGKVRYDAGKGLAFAGADLTTGLNGTIKREVGPVTLIPALAGATELRVVGRFLKWFNNTAKIDGAVNVGTDLTLGIVDTDGQIGFKPAEGALATGLELGVGSGVDGFKTRLSGGGTGKIMWQIPANPGYYKGCEFTLSAKLDINWKLFSATFQGSHTFPEAAPTAMSVFEGFGPVPRTYLDLGPYNRFVAPDSAPARGALSDTAPMEITTDAVVTNIYPYAGPAVARHGNRVAMAYVYNDPDDPPLQATEIVIIDWDDGAYSAPVTLSDDTRAEFSPVLAYDANGALIGVWERVRSENFTSSGDGAADMAAMAADLEIVYAVRDPDTGQWSVPAPLTDNSYLDHEPLLSRAADGSVLLVWRSNTGSLLIGDAATPSRMHAAVWDPVTRTFSASTDIGLDFVNALQFSMANDGNAAVVAHVQDGDGDLSTTADQHIELVTFDGSGWSSAPVAMTVDETADIGPRVLYDAGGNMELAWRRGEDLVRRTGTDAYEVVRGGSGGLSFADFRFFCTPDNRLVIVWQGQSGEQVDLFYVARDLSTGTWSGDVRLTNDTALEQDAAGVFAADGALHLVYARELIDTGQSDLYHLIYRLGGDLTVAAADLSVDPSAPLPGSATTLTARILNAGDTAYANVPVRFYLGDPAAGGTLIGDAAVTPAALPGASWGTASVAWTVPAEPAGNRVYVVVDPDNGFSEVDEANNTASFEALKPDLTVRSVRVDNLGDGSADVVALIANQGAVAALQVETLFFAGDKELGIAAIPRLSPGMTAEISRRYWAGTDFEGDQTVFEAVVDPDNRIAEYNETNNRAGALFVAAPIAAITPERVAFDALAPGGATASQTVAIRNEGGADLTVSAVQLSATGDFSLDLAGGPAPLGTALPAVLASGEIRTLTVILSPQNESVSDATLTITTNDPNAATAAITIHMTPAVAPAPVMSATPAQFAFGEVVAGDAAPPVTISLTNAGTAPLTVSGLTLSDATAFTVDANGGDAPLGSLPAVLPPSATRTLTLVFAPQTTGTHSAEITIVSDDAATPTTVLTVTGTGIDTPPAATPKAILAPGTFYFGTVAGGETSPPLAVFIVNDGGAPLNVTGVSLSDGQAFQVDLAGGSAPIGALPAAVPPGESRTVAVVFSPPDAAGYATELVVASDDPSSPQASIRLTGNDPFTGAANIVVTPPALDFGDVDQWATSAPATITIGNDGAMDLTVSDIGGTEAFSVDVNGGSQPVGTLPATIPPGETRTVTVTFTPAAAIDYSTVTTVYSDDPDAPEVNVAVTGTGLHVTAPAISVAPAALGFQTVTVGSDAATVLTVSNTGDADLTVSSLTLTDTALFTIDTNAGSAPIGTLPAVIPPSGTRTLGVRFTPAAAGEVSAVLTVGSDASGAAQKTVAISGTGALPTLAAGDINGNGGIDMGDAVLALQASAGMGAGGLVSGYGNADVDVDGDGRPGLAEALFALQTLAGVRIDGSLPESDHPYADNENRQWSYTLAGNPAAIDVVFDFSTAVEDNYDFIYITGKDGSDVNGSPFTGTALAGQTVRVTGDTVVIRLVSDESVGDWGFRVTGVAAADSP